MTTVTTERPRESEASLEGFFRKRVRLVGGYTVKLAPTEAGIPDRLVIFPGNRLYLVELKAEGGRLSPIQQVLHQRLYDNYDVPVYVLTGRAEILTWLRQRVNALGPQSSPPGRPRIN